MKLVVFGATGGTGQHILTQALQAGHSVTAVARDPSQLAITHDQLHTVPGDVLDPATLLGCTDGADAVLSALGVGTSRSPTSVYSAGITNILHPMRQAAVRRILVISALPVTPAPKSGSCSAGSPTRSCTGYSVTATPTWLGWNSYCTTATRTGRSSDRRGLPTHRQRGTTAPP